MSRQAPPVKPPSRNRRPDNPHYPSTMQVAKLFGVSRNTVQNWVATGQLKALRIGNKPLIRFDPAELERFANSQTPAQTLSDGAA
jgi:excisionase family DNA binding protein